MDTKCEGVIRCRSWWFILGNHGLEEKTHVSSPTGFGGSVVGLQIPSMTYPPSSTFRIILKKNKFRIVCVDVFS